MSLKSDHVAAGGVFDVPDWTSPSDYQALMGADPSAFAWEWTRRSDAYRRAWSSFVHAGMKATGEPRRFGLEHFEDPSFKTPLARPMWSRRLLSDAVTAHLGNRHALKSQRIDLRILAPLVTIVIDDEEIEHLLLSDGRHFLRIDIVSGTLIGCPASLIYLLEGLSAVRGPLATLTRLARLVQKGCFEERPIRNPQSFQRSILELRVADALAAGCDQRRIARALFGAQVSEVRWRRESAPFRRRVQRLVMSARSGLDAPLAGWLGSPP